MHERAGEPTLTSLLSEIRNVGSEPARTRVFQAVYGELHLMAGRLMANERSDHTLRPTALVHETFLRLVEGENVAWENRAHFFGIAATAMRRILVEHARERSAEKRGGRAIRVTFSEHLLPGSGFDTDLLDLHQALEALAQLDPRGARVAEMRLFAELSAREIAVVLGIARRTVDKDWSMARAWLARELARRAS